MTCFNFVNPIKTLINFSILRKNLPILFLLICWICPLSTNATHIVGGEMNYTCLGNNDYEITLVIFRDCYNGNPNAFFDDPASIGVFDANNVLLNEFLIPWNQNLNDTLSPVLSSECFVAPPDVCVHTTTYTAIVNLPPVTGGYQLAYQRCCRNVTIKNIVEPLETGATYGLTISEKALEECNSNPKFNDWPPIYICVNEPIHFDQSAFDVDGDSIVYKLCTPLQGAHPDIPRPQPPNSPPYDEIVWVNPPYNVNNMLNGFPGDAALEIDLHTGLLTGFPNTVGQFVVGICVEEYRNGALISTTRRDFQYNVGVCGQPVASFSSPELQCNDLKVHFENESTGTNTFLWLFNDPNNPNPTSNQENPTYTFSDIGTYEIQLISDPNSICADTFSRTIVLENSSLTANFNTEVIECSDSLLIQVTDLSFDSISSPTAWFWEILGTELISHEQHPTFVLTTNGFAELQLTVSAENGCLDSLVERFPVNLIEVELDNDTLFVCEGNSISLNPAGDDEYLYEWFPVDDLDDSTSDNPSATPDTTTTYIANISDGEMCQIERHITVAVIDTSDQIDFVFDTQCSGFSVQFTSSSENAPFFVWHVGDPDNPMATISGANPSYTYPDTGFYTVMVTLMEEIPCPDTIFKEIHVNQPLIEVAFDVEYETCSDTANIAFTDLSVNEQSTITSWNWNFSNNKNSSEQNPIITVENSQTLGISLIINSDDGCVDSIFQEVDIQVIDVNIKDTIPLCNGLPTFLNPDFNPNYEYLWSPATGLDNPTSPNPLANPTEATTYTVTISNFGSDTCQFIKDVHLIFPPPIEVTRTKDTTICEHEMLLFADSEQAVSFLWSEQADFSNPFAETAEVIVSPEDESVYFVQITDDFGCQIQEEIHVFGAAIRVELEGFVTLCLGDTTQLEVVNLSTEQDLMYQWSPENFILSGANTATPTVRPDNNIAYSVQINNQFGCEFLGTTQVEVFDFTLPLSIQAAPDTIRTPGESTQLTATFDNSYTYTWAASETLSATDIYNPIATPLETTLYTLNISHSNGCINESSILLVVQNALCEAPFIFIPKGFTPNQDGKNDILFVRSNIIEELYFAIYSRWGQKVFETTDSSQGWDGTFEGKALQAGVFGYYVQAKCFNGEEYFKKGNVTLLR